ncbi:MAG: HD domain-containing phosphohydrolase [Syntrophomonadaceae bacterium]
MPVVRIWKQNRMLQVENQILQEALNDLKNSQFFGNPLLPKYAALTQHYGKLLRLTIKLLKISDSQQRNLQKIQRDMRNLLENADQGFLTFGQDLKVDSEYSVEWINIFGTKIEDLDVVDLVFSTYAEDERKSITELLQMMWDKSGFKNLDALKELPNHIDIGGRYYRLEYRPVKTIRDNQDQDMIMMVITDITERQKAWEQINYLNYYDKLTGLYNRAYIDMAFSRLNIEDNLPLAMIIGDVNGLKITNDVFGHLQGDRLLQNIASVLRRSLRAEDVIARWGGDEFLIILPRTDEQMAACLCKRIKDVCSSTPPDPIRLSIALGSAVRTDIDESYQDTFNRAEEQMYTNKSREKQQVYSDILLVVEKNLKEHTSETDEHLARMTQMARAMAQKLGFSSMQVQELEALAVMHDIGKITVAPEILNKPGRLNHAEWEIVKKHCETGYRISQVLSKYQVADCILAHHERWDGTGYPNGLKGEQIPLLARIIAIIDAYDVITHDVPYKPALSSQQALEELERCSGTQFDPELVKVFISVLSDTNEK